MAHLPLGQCHMLHFHVSKDSNQLLLRHLRYSSSSTAAAVQQQQYISGPAAAPEHALGEAPTLEMCCKTATTKHIYAGLSYNPGHHNSSLLSATTN